MANKITWVLGGLLVLENIVLLNQFRYHLAQDAVKASDHKTTTVELDNCLAELPGAYAQFAETVAERDSARAKLNSLGEEYGVCLDERNFCRSLVRNNNSQGMIDAELSWLRESNMSYLDDVYVLQTELIELDLTISEQRDKITGLRQGLDRCNTYLREGSQASDKAF